MSSNINRINIKSKYKWTNLNIKLNYIFNLITYLIKLNLN